MKYLIIGKIAVNQFTSTYFQKAILLRKGQHLTLYYPSTIESQTEVRKKNG